MKTAALMSGERNVVTYTSNPGVSRYAELIRNEFDTINQSIVKTISFGDHLLRIVENILQVKNEYSKESWDGYNAKAVDDLSLKYSLRFALSLPPDIPAPEIDVVPNGDIVFTWTTGNRNTFSVIIGNRGELYHAGLYGVARIHGIEYFSYNIPDIIIAGVKRVYSQE